MYDSYMYMLNPLYIYIYFITKILHKKQFSMVLFPNDTRKVSAGVLYTSTLQSFSIVVLRLFHASNGSLNKLFQFLSITSLSIETFIIAQCLTIKNNIFLISLLYI